MSLFGSLTTAIGGLTAQSRALGAISDNVSNSQTTGYKRVDTNFISLLTSSSASSHSPGSTVARPDYTNGVQGTIEQTDNPLSLAVGGQGFFAVAAARGTEAGQTVFDDRQIYTRGGDFRMDKEGYLVNGAGYYLQGWTINGNAPDRTTIQPIRVTQQVFNPIATSTIKLSANLAADNTSGLPAYTPSTTIPAPAPSGITPSTTQLSLYDSLGKRHTVNMTYTPIGANAWQMALTTTAPNGTQATIGSVDLLFGSAGPALTSGSNTEGTIAQITNAVAGSGAGTAISVGTPTAATDQANVSFSFDFGSGPQAMTLNLGTYNQATGLTQYAGQEFSVRSMTQDGVPLGSYSGLTIAGNGDVSINYDNGQSRPIYRVPLVSFSDADKLQRLDGQGFMRTVDSGEARVNDVSTNGVGKLVVGSVERSNVDIASEFTKLIVAQRAYSANTKIVSATDEMLQDTINMRR